MLRHQKRKCKILSEVSMRKIVVCNDIVGTFFPFRGDPSTVPCSAVLHVNQCSETSVKFYLLVCSTLVKNYVL